jgi:uncharacterized protein YdbL (DUF1318 family)
MTRTKLIAALVCSSLLAVGVAQAAIGDPVLDGAIQAGQIGEQADGYLGAVTASTPADVRARLDQVNIRRRAAYTDRAQARNVTVDEMARATGCTLLPKNTPTGAYFRSETGAWTRNTGAITLPAYCPK